MLIKSFHAGLANGITKAYETVDQKVLDELGPDVVIISVSDTVHFQKEITKHNDATPELPSLFRVVVYEKKRKRK